MSTNGVYNHRTLQPTTRTVPPAAQPPPPPPVAGMTNRLAEALDVIRQEFETVSSDREAMRLQRDEYEAKINAQLTEVNMIRRSFYDLEAQQSKVRQRYEDELNRLRAEIALLRSQGPGISSLGVGSSVVAGTSTSASAAPGNGLIPPALVDTFPRESRFERERSVGISMSAHTSPQFEHREKPSRGGAGADLERENDRVVDQRDPKRPKPERIRTDSSPGLPPAHSLYAPSSSSAQPTTLSIPPGPGSAPPPPSTLPHSGGRDASDYSVTLPPIGAGVGPGGGPPKNPNAIAQEDLQLAPPEFRKEGSDWFAVFNPKIPRVLDISLVHTLSHTSVVCCVQFSADGKYMATGCNRTAQIYDVASGQRICVLLDDQAAKTGDLYIRSVRFSPDGKLLATGAEDRQIRIWDIAKKRIRNVFDGHQQEIYSLDFSRDGRFIVSGSGDRTARIWDMNDLTCKVLTINDQDSLNGDAGVTSVAISPDGRYVAAGSLDTVVRIWDVASGQLLERLRGHRDSVYSVAFTPDGKGLVSGSLDKTLKFWDVSGLMMGGGAATGPGTPGSAGGVMKGRKEGGNGAGESPVGRKPGEKIGSSPCTMDFVGHKDYVLSVSVSHDGKWVVSGSKDRCVQFWDARTATLQFMLQGHKNSVISLDVNPTGGLLATGSGDNLARIWRYTTI